MKIKSIDELPSVKKYLSRIGAEARGLRTAVIKVTIKNKYWREVASIKFNENGETGKDEKGKKKKNAVVKVYSPEGDASEFEPTETEEVAILEDLKSVSWPTIQPIKNIQNPPPAVKNAGEGNVFEFRNEAGDIVMLQVRMEQDATDGGREKVYIPYTYWSDNEWRCAEPDGPLPLFNAHKLKNAALIYVHEGARTADVMQRMVEAMTRQEREKLENHPWSEEMAAGVHVGWIGGAMNAHRTDWSPINRSTAKRVIIVPDNDEPGIEAVNDISERVRRETLHIQWDSSKMPLGWDMADPWPASLFVKGDEEKLVYTGPSMRELLQPATWATDLVQGASGRPAIVIRPHFMGQWRYVEKIDGFVCVERPDLVYTDAKFNKVMTSFSHTKNLSQYILREYNGKTIGLSYRPDVPHREIYSGSQPTINLHIPCMIPAHDGPIDPFLEYMNYMFPNEAERDEMLRWCATLIARPDVRMGYGLLLVSVTQGIGKTTLGERVLRPLVGGSNVSSPGEKQIVESQFNSWAAAKRLIIVNEIYAGKSWKAYHSTKPLITDPTIEVNEKFMPTVMLENWAHVFACSNSLAALKIEKTDRRWFLPELSETVWPLEKFAELHRYLRGGGLSFIRRWAQRFEEKTGMTYVSPGEFAPMTARKQASIEESMSEAQKECAALANVLNEKGQGAEGSFGAVPMVEVKQWIRQTTGTNRIYDSERELRQAMIEQGCRQFEKRLTVAGRKDYIIINSKLSDHLKSLHVNDRSKAVREAMMRPSDLLEPAL